MGIVNEWVQQVEQYKKAKEQLDAEHFADVAYILGKDRLCIFGERDNETFEYSLFDLDADNNNYAVTISHNAFVTAKAIIEERGFEVELVDFKTILEKDGYDTTDLEDEDKTTIFITKASERGE